MANEEMDELLSRLEELDTVTYHYWAAFRFALHHELEMDSLPAIDHLQGCIQRACSARMWLYVIDSSRTIYLNPSIIAKIYAPIKNDPNHRYRDPFREEGNSPALALLKAYLAALESENK